MKASACVVQQTKSDWIIAIGDAQPVKLSIANTKPAELAQAVLDYVIRAQSSYGRCHEKIVLCPESRATLFATSPLPPALKSSDRQQLKYHVESLLPVDAEKMAADFVRAAGELRVLAMDSQVWQPIIDAFSALNLHFRWIAPASILALQEFTRTVRDVSPVVVWEEEGVCDLWQFDAAGIERWTHLEDSNIDTSSDRLLAMRLFAAQSPEFQSPEFQSWTAINCSKSTLEQLEQLKSIEIRSIETKSQASFAAAAADRLCQKNVEAWFDLRDGAIAGQDRYRALFGWVRIATASVAALLIAFSSACLWQKSKAERQIAVIEEAHKALYMSHFTGDIPSYIGRRIKIELEKVQGSTGNSQIPLVPSALALLHAALTAVSMDNAIHVQATEITIMDGELRAEIILDNRQDATTLAQRLTAVGFSHEPLQTSLEKGKTKATIRVRMLAKQTNIAEVR